MKKFRINGKIYEAATPAEAYKLHDDETKQSLFAGVMQQFNQGLTLGGADELSAALSGDYEKSIKTQQMQRERFQKEHPWISGASTATGASLPVIASLLAAPETAGASTALAGGRALQLTRAALGLGGGGRSVVTGMQGAKEGARVAIPVGAVSGYLSAPPEQRGTGLASGAILGGVLGGGTGYAAARLPSAVQAVQNAARRVRERVAPSAAPPAASQSSGIASPAEARILRAMTESGVSPENAMAQIAEARRLNVPLGVLDVGGTQTQRLGRSVRTLPGEGSNIVETALEERAASQPQRVISALERGLGTRATGRGEAVLDDLLMQARTQSGPYYRQLADLPEITDPTVRAQFELPAVRNIVQNAEESAAAWGRPRQPLYAAQNTAGTPTRFGLARNPTFQDVDLVNQNINEMLRSSYSINPRPVPGAPVATRTERNMASAVRGELVGAADLAPGGEVYYRARSGYAGPAEAGEFYEAGLDFPKEGAVDVNAILGGATQPQSKWYRRGQIEALRQKIMSVPDLSSQPNVLRSFWGSPESRARLQSSIPQVRNRAADLEARLRLENEAVRSSNFVRGGSQTADKAAEAIDLITPETILNATNAPVRTAITSAWNAISGQVGKETRAQVARHLTSFNNPEQSLAFLQRLQELQARGRLNTQAVDAAAAATTIANQVRN